MFLIVVENSNALKGLFDQKSNMSEWTPLEEKTLSFSISRISDWTRLEYEKEKGDKKCWKMSDKLKIEEKYENKYIQILTFSPFVSVTF